MKMLKKNNLFLGIGLAAVAPALSFMVLYFLNDLFQHWLRDGQMILTLDTMLMTAIFLNLFIFMPYLKTNQYERTGRGVLLVTFVGVVVLFLVIL